MTRKIIVRVFIPVCLLLSLTPSLWARGKDQIVTRAAEGKEVWQENFDVTESKAGKYNVLITAKDAAGNDTQSGPFNLRVDPNAGLPAARVVYPDANAILRRDIRFIGVASGRFGVNRVLVRLDDQDPRVAEGSDYWNLVIPIASLKEGIHTVWAQAYDVKGVAGPEYSVPFIVDRAAPSIELVSHKTGDLISGNVVISGRADDANGISSVAYSADGGETFDPLPFKAKKGETGVTFTFPVRTKDKEDGPVVYYIRTVDKTGIETVKPYLFFVDNQGPELEILSPQPAEDVYGLVTVMGRIYDVVGLDRFYYEWGDKTSDILLRPGDPYWTVGLDFSMAPKNADSFKVTAVDKSGNLSSASIRFQDKRKVKVPTLVIDYPPQAVLNALPPDGSIFGHIERGFTPDSVVIDGLAEEISALPAFRISPDMIPQGRGTLRVYPKAAGGVAGTPVQIRFNKPAPVPGPDGTVPAVSLTPSRISLSAPAANAWLSGPSFILEGRVSNSPRLEFRLGPDVDWRPISLDGEGNFRAEISIAQVDEGPIHMELRTTSGGVGDLPFYYPLNRVTSRPEIQIITPTGRVHGRVTVSGLVSAVLPITEISYSEDNATYIPLNFQSRYGMAWFTLSQDFTAMNNAGGGLTFRVTDASGASYIQGPAVTFDASADTPTMIVNAPTEGDVVTEDFEISGIAFDDDGIAAVNWRIIQPAAGDGDGGEGGEEEEPPPFQKISTSQSFQVAVPLSAVIDGENVIEVYAEDISGIQSQTITRTVKVSLAPPEATVLEPAIVDYNRHNITIRGTSSDANGVEEVNLSMDNGTTYQRTRGTEEWNLSLNTTAYKDGVYSLLVRTIDKYGIEAISNALINIDNTPPELSIGAPASGDRVGTLLEITGRVQDNVELETVKLQLINVAGLVAPIGIDLNSELVIMENMDISALPQGEYVLRINAQDRAGNESLVSRKIQVAVDDTASEVVLYNPMPGLDHSGPLFISGKVSGADIPRNLTLFVNQNSAALVEVDRYGFFRYQYPDERLTREENMIFAAGFDSPSGERIISKEHSVHYVPLGPILTVESHQDGDVITGRPWLSGRAWISVAPVEEMNLTREQKNALAVREVMISFDNGRSFGRASGKERWKFRLETGDLPLGHLPVLIKAEFADGSVAVRRLILTVDTNVPQVETIEPVEDSTHRDILLVYGTASDDFELDGVEISLRPGDKAGYSVPGFIQGMYLDANVLGATWVDMGLGLSFFKDNVKLQFQVGFAPEMDPYTQQAARFLGTVAGFKLLANIFYLPFDYFLGPDWSFFSMSFALGANFSYFTMDPDNDRPGLVMGAFLGQFEFFRADLSHFFPNWKYAKTLSLYVEPIFWFASSEVKDVDVIIPRITLGARINIF
ncbi:MAG: neuraminidase [Treponema sp.]|nr:neuraminidase [Treponema sp.]